MKHFSTQAYTDYKRGREEAINAFLEKYAFFAFNNEQLEEGLQRFKTEIAAGDKMVRFMVGCFVLKSKFNEFYELVEKRGETLKELMRNPDFAGGAFLYEIANHEYMINWQADFDVCSCFGDIEYQDSKDYHDYLNELGYTDQAIHDAYRDAVMQHAKEAEENDWY